MEMEATFKQQSILSNMAEKIQAIGSSVYLQWGMVITLLGLTAAMVEHKVTVTSELRMLQRNDDRTEQVVKQIQSDYPTKEWLEAKLETIRMEINHKNDKSQK